LNVLGDCNAVLVSRVEKTEPAATGGVKEEKKDGPKQIDNSKEAAMEAEVQAARQRAVVPLEIRMKQFRDMLAEKEVHILFFFHVSLVLKVPPAVFRHKLAQKEVHTLFFQFEFECPFWCVRSRKLWTTLQLFF
jgi:hypothetical protein